jgi:hypothetical protein
MVSCESVVNNQGQVIGVVTSTAAILPFISTTAVCYKTLIGLQNLTMQNFFSILLNNYQMLIIMKQQ